MEVRSRDTYRIEYSGGISEEIVLSLMHLYQPLIGPAAANLFLTMAAEGMRQHLLKVPGVTKVNLYGTQDEKLYVEKAKRR